MASIILYQTMPKQESQPRSWHLAERYSSICFEMKTANLRRITGDGTTCANKLTSQVQILGDLMWGLLRMDRVDSGIWFGENKWCKCEMQSLEASLTSICHLSALASASNSRGPTRALYIYINKMHLGSAVCYLGSAFATASLLQPFPFTDLQTHVYCKLPERCWIRRLLARLTFSKILLPVAFIRKTTPRGMVLYALLPNWHD